mgnify:CR=1 FL=1
MSDYRIIAEVDFHVSDDWELTGEIAERLDGSEMNIVNDRLRDKWFIVEEQ